MTRITKFLFAVLILAMILSACVINPVVPSAVFDVTATARVQAIPPLPTITDPTVPPTATVSLVPTVTPTPEAVATMDCEIKVNRASDGELIYHLPGQPTYNKTKIDPAKDEFFACTEQDAIDAGARKAKR